MRRGKTKKKKRQKRTDRPKRKSGRAKKQQSTGERPQRVQLAVKQAPVAQSASQAALLQQRRRASAVHRCPELPLARPSALVNTASHVHPKAPRAAARPREPYSRVEDSDTRPG